MSKGDSIPHFCSASYTCDFTGNFFGGIKKNVGYLGMANFIVEIKSEDLGWWKNTELYVKAANTHGNLPSSEWIGDFQVASNIEAGNLTYLQELRLSQKFWDFEIRAGLMDLNTDFLVTENGSEYLNSSFGVVPTISSNLPAPIFPLTSIGLYLSYEFNAQTTIKTAVFDGKPDDWDINPHNIYWSHRANEGWMNFTELSHEYTLATKAGSFKFGGYYHSPYQEKNEKGKYELIKKNYGLYLISDQELLEFPNQSKLNAFLQLAWSPVKNNNPSFYAGLGLNLFGINSKNEKDNVGLALAKIFFHNPSKSESAIEIFYKHFITESFYIQPDFQFIIHPSGTENNLENAVVGFIRFGIEI